MSREPLQKKGKEPAQRRRSAPWLLGGLVLLLLAIIVAQQPLDLWRVVPPDTASDTLLLYALSSLNFAAFVVFGFILLRSLIKLRRERRERELGSKIKTRLVVYFIGLSLLPITAMAAFSYLFLNRTVEKWFARLPETVVQKAREQQRESQAAQNRNLRETARLLAALIKEQAPSQWQNTLGQLAATGELSALEIVSSDGDVIARSESEVPADERAELELLLGEAGVAKGDAGEQFTTGVGLELMSVPLQHDASLIIVRHRLGDSDVNEALAGSQSEYQHLLYRQRKVRMLGLSTLGLMTLLLLFASTWLAIHIARGIATPIKSLAEASKEVARGNLSYRVENIAEDELALLAESFNQMTAELEENRRHIEAGAAELKEKNLALEERRNYIETVLESLSTGVISLDQDDRVTTINAAAASMLRVAAAPPAKCTLADLVGDEDCGVLERLLRRARRAGRAAEQTQLTRGLAQQGSAIPVALTATALRGAREEARGVVLVIEDLSELLAAQRAAAWSEVARRMAHEIKNPLTPIQLSAERIARNFQLGHNAGNGEGLRGDGLSATEQSHEELARVVEECTASITREVAGLKAMVDEFSRFARLPHPQMEAADLNEVVVQATSLYQDRLDGVDLRLNLAESLPAAMLDREQIKRVFVNLIDNALEALEKVPRERLITIATWQDSLRDVLVAEVGDTGEGIQRGDFRRLFQPYFSTRGRGTGLGLAIVQRIVTEHGGRIRADSNHPCGAKFVIELPAIVETDVRINLNS